MREARYVSYVGLFLNQAAYDIDPFHELLKIPDGRTVGDGEYTLAGLTHHGVTTQLLDARRAGLERVKALARTVMPDVIRKLASGDRIVAEKNLRLFQRMMRRECTLPPPPDAPPGWLGSAVNTAKAH